MTYYSCYGDELTVEYPSGSGVLMNLEEVAQKLSRRQICIFLKDDKGKRPVHGNQHLYAKDPHFRELVLFYEYFHGDDSHGLGVSHQTGWTGLVAELIANF